MQCESCAREIPEDEFVCPHCNDETPEPAPGYRELRREARSLRGWLVLSLMFGIVMAPFAIWRATRALAHFRGKAAAEDPVSYRQLVVTRRLSIALLAFWALLIAGRFGLQWDLGDRRDAEVVDAVVTQAIFDCDCPNEMIWLSSSAVDLGRKSFERITEGRRVRRRDALLHQDDSGPEVTVKNLRYFGDDKALVAVQLHAGSGRSYGAELTLQRGGDGVWTIIHRETAWKS